MKYIKSYKIFENKKVDIRIVLTGGPGTGKSSVCEKLIELGYKVIDEPARILITEFQKNAPQNLPWNNRDFFQKSVEDMSIKNYVNNKSGFFDRSLVDEIGFRTYYNMDISSDLLNKCNKYRYDIVFIFPPWQEIYRNDDVRKETFEQCVEINKNLMNGYKMVGYNPIEVPKASLEERIEFILNNI